MAIEFEPIDPNRCQYEEKKRSFMTFGPRAIIRCKSKPKFVCVEREPREDGKIGAMSLCEVHIETLIEVMGDGYASHHRILEVE